MPNKSKYSIDFLNEHKSAESILTAINFAPVRYSASGRGYKVIFCKCDCGGEVVVDLYAFAHGSAISCGCLKGKKISKARRKYSHYIRKMYNSYLAMIRRCYDINYNHYKYYGGRGVKVCEEWRHSYQNFLDWSLKNGWQEGYELDKDIKGNGLLYSPETCLWVTKKENNEAKRKYKNISAYKNGELVYNFKDINEAISVLGGSHGGYALALRGKQKTVFGHTLQINY